jgi:glyoxylase-like metal-dependent hydrolase (beta-lactamase superfamily II)
VAPFTADPAQAVASLDRLSGTEAAWLLPGHGPAWTGGVPEAIAEVRRRAKPGALSAGESEGR